MADMYSYSGHKLPALPELPEGCTHAVIYYDTEDSVYYLFCSSERIVYNENNVPQLPATTSWGGYACRAGGTYWFSATFTPEGDVENPDYYLLDQVLLWTNTDICQKDTDTVVLAATTPLQYPTITSISSSRSYTLGEEAETLICEASVNDGELSYQWYHGEEAVGEGNSYTPDVSVVGSEGYYCIVTNTVSDTQLTTTSKTITITVEEEKKFPVVAYVSGLVARLHSRRMPYPYSHRAPVAYLYNGVRLPALPEWDKETYDHIFPTTQGILRKLGGDIETEKKALLPETAVDFVDEVYPIGDYVLIADTMYTVTLNGEQYKVKSVGVDVGGGVLLVFLGNLNMVAPDFPATSAPFVIAYAPDEAQTVLMHKDGDIGTITISISEETEPIPITAPTIEPLSMWMGWKAGNWVARQRGEGETARRRKDTHCVSV